MRSVVLAAGSRLYVWEEKSERRTPITGEERYNPQTGTDTIVLNPSQRVPLDCTTELETDAKGVVTHGPPSRREWSVASQRGSSARHPLMPEYG